MTLTRGITSPCVKRAITSCSRQTLNAALAGQAEDFCFRTLADELGERSRPAALEELNHLGRPSRDLASRLLQGAAPRAVLSASLDLPQERALRRRLSNESRHLNQLARGAASGLERSVWSRAAAEALSDSGLATLRMSEQVGRCSPSCARPPSSSLTRATCGSAWSWRPRRSRPGIRRR